MKKPREIIHQGLLDPEKITSYFSGYPIPSYANYVANKVGLEGVLAVAGLLSPAFVEYDNAIFLAENCSNLSEIDTLQEKYLSDPGFIERYINLTCLPEFFLLAANDACDDDHLLEEFGRILIHFWSLRLRQLFPDKTFEFELKEDLFDEEGLCLTFSQRR